MFDLPEVASRSTTAILYIYIFVRPSANENPPPSSRFDASILSNGVEEEEEEEEEEGLLLYYVVLERGAIERRGATSVDKTRSFRARKLGDSGGREGEERGGGAIDRAETLRASPVRDWGSSVGKLFGLVRARLRF